MKIIKKAITNNTKIVPNNQEKVCLYLQDIVIFGQICGLFPLENVAADKHVARMKFQWKSWKLLYTITLFIGFFICFVTGIRKAFIRGTLLVQLVSPLFYIHVSGTTLIFIQISKNWPAFLKSCTQVDLNFINANYANVCNARRKVNLIVLVSNCLVILEHGLATANFILSKYCQNYYTGWEHYFRKQFHFIFNYFDYHFVYGFLLLILSWIGTFIWNFGDTFIIVMSQVMQIRFQQINRHVKKHMELQRHSLNIEITGHFGKVSDSKELEIKFWRRIREDYNQLSNLVSKLDSLLSNLVVLVYVCNLTFILMQLFISVRGIEGTTEIIYFFVSFGFVILRTTAVCIYGGQLNEESLALLPLLQGIPSECFNEEIQRLMQQIQADGAKLTGHNFFVIKKGLVLSVAAAIITYELVLIQFNQSSINGDTSHIVQNDSLVCL